MAFVSLGTAGLISQQIESTAASDIRIGKLQHPPCTMQIPLAPVATGLVVGTWLVHPARSKGTLTAGIGWAS